MKILQQFNEALQVFLVYLLRHGDACFPKVPGFAKVKIGEDQRLLFFPIDGAGGGKPKVLAFQDMLDGWLQGGKYTTVLHFSGMI